MKKYIKIVCPSAIFCLIFMLSIKVYAITGDPQITYFRNIGNNIEDIDNWKFEFTFSNNEKVTLKNSDSYTFLMINGTIIPNVNLPIINGRTYVPLRVLSTELGMTVKWNQKEKVVSISKGDILITIAANKNNPDVKFINDSIYIYFKLMKDNFPVELEYRPSSSEAYDPFHILRHPVVIIDEKMNTESLTKSQAVKLTKNKLLEGYVNFVNNKKYNPGEYGKERANDEMSRLKNDIENICYINEISRYYILGGPYLTIIDKYTGEIYFLRYWINKSEIKKIDINNPEIFANKYFIG